MKKIGELKTPGIHFVIYCDENAKVNPYRIYRKYWDNGWKKRLLEKYADLYSCTCYICGYTKTLYWPIDGGSPYAS